jgi:hypothetical protein
VNAWCEVVAMASSFLVSLVFATLARGGSPVSTHVALLVTVVVTSACWIATAFLAPPTSDEVLVAFYLRVRPFGPGWARIEALANVPDDDRSVPKENIPLGLAGWFVGCVLIWSALFAVGSALYGRTAAAAGLAVVALASAAALVAVVRRLWTAPGA